MLKKYNYFYFFSGFHAVFLGITPFFLPVIIYEKTQSLSSLFQFISITALSFFICLFLFDKLKKNHFWRSLINISFIAQFIIIFSILYFEHVNLILLALINGVFSCFYWTMTRVFIINITQNNNIGRKYGFFQIIVGVLLKIGILIGGILLSLDNIWYIIFFSFFVCCLSLIYLNTALLPTFNLNNTDKKEKFGSRYNSITLGDKFIFCLDGAFLYLESYFWTLTLYFIANHSYYKLGFIIVITAAILMGIFYLIKNIIDQYNSNFIFHTSILLYLASWVLRSYTMNLNNPYIVYLNIVVIAFMTSFFRLSFNQRFFKTAKNKGAYCYLFNKSLYSQFTVFILFLLLLFFIKDKSTLSTLQNAYDFAAFAALFYLCYKKPITP